LCIYTTTLERILAKITDVDEPAASRRKAAACFAEKTFFTILICARHQKILLKRKRKFFCSAPRDYARAAGFNSDEAKQKLFLREEKDFALPRLFFVLGRGFRRAGGCGRNARRFWVSDLTYTP
jgi:hypothetical protein